MKWPFLTGEHEEVRREEEKQSRKCLEATRMLADLFIRRNSLAPAEIVAKLEQIHEFYAVASSAPSDAEPGGYLEQIVKDLSAGYLSASVTARLVSMLSWPELRRSEDRTGPSRLVTAAVQNPSQAYIPTLNEHLAWLQKRVNRRESNQYQTDIESEIRLTKSAIQACHLQP